MRERVVELTVPADAEGARLDQFLTERARQLTRSAWGRLIRDGSVELDGVPAAKPGVALRPGCRIRAILPPPPPDRPIAEDIPLSIVYEDDAILVVDKAAGMVVHPGHGRRSGTLVNALLARGGPLASVAGSDRPGIVHRLDAGTSGVLVVARTDDVHRVLSRAFAARTVRKRYLAVVWGHPDPAEGVIDRSIGRSRVDPLRMDTRLTRGRPRSAISEYRTLESFPGFSFVEVFPRTGRTHQIRVHMVSINHALVGDERYGGRRWRGIQDPVKRKVLREFQRLALHARSIGFDHPVTGRPVRFKAPLPPEFENLLDALRPK